MIDDKTGRVGVGGGAVDASTAVATVQDTKGQDLQHAVDFYQKGTELAHNATTYEDQCRAIEQFSLAIAIRSNQPRFFFARANALRSINEYAHAVKDYSKAITLDDRSAQYYANRGSCYRKLNQPTEALEDFTVAIEMDAKKGNHYFNRALVLYDAGFYKEAIIDFSKALEDGVTSGGGGGINIRIEYRALQNRGNCYRRLGNLTKCIDDLQSAIKLDSRNATAFASLAQAYFEGGNYDSAIDDFTHAIALNSANASYYSHRGLCYYRKGEGFERQCLADFNRSIQIDGKDPQAYFYRGSVRFALAIDSLRFNSPAITSSNSSTGETANATMLVPKSFSAQDAVTEANDGLSSSSASLGYLTPEEQLEAAFADIEMAWTLRPTRTQYQIGMAMITQLKKQYYDAATLFDEINAADRNNLIVKYHLALNWQILDEPEKALEVFTDAIDIFSNEPLFFHARGLLLQSLQLHLLAIEDFTRAIELTQSQNASNLYLRAESYLRLEKFQEAVAECTTAIESGFADNVSVRNVRAMAYRGLGEYDRALDDLSACLIQSAKNDIFHFHRALCYMECGQYANALPDFHAAAVVNPHDAKILYYIGLCYYHEYQPQKCIKFMQRALSNRPTHDFLPDLYYHMGLSYALENKNIDAIKHFTSALERSLDCSPPANDIAAATPMLHTQMMYVHERAKALQLEHSYEDAIKDFSFIIHHNPHNAHAYFRRGFAYKALGKLREAASDLETAKLLDPTNLKLVVDYKEIHDIDCIILCPPGQEKVF